MKKSENVPDYPKKLYYRINEVGKITSIKPYVLRYWETEFKQLRPEKDTKSQRRYRQEDIALIFKIRELLYERRFTIAGAREQLRLEMRGAKSQSQSSSPSKSPAATKREVLKQLSDVKKDLAKIHDSFE
jgi:DNA-binding transcriptional MerR regulator